MPLSSPSDWEDNAELYHRAFWLDSAPPPLDDNFLSGSVTSEGAIGSPQNFPLPQQIPARDLSRQPKQEPQVSEGNFPSFDGAFGQEPNGLYASETALPALTGDMYASGCPPQSVGYNPVPAPQQYWTPSLPSAVSQNFGCLDQFVGIENLHLGRAPFEYDQIQETQAFSSTCQNNRLPNSAQQFILDTNRQRLPSSSPSAIVQTFKNPSFVAVPEPTLTNIMRGRVRARRGQATDPHSIAERLRREKISERMKNLQELVPNATKTDKASMLESIISYVKFLQLQVKLLSTSRVRVVQADAIPSEEKSGHRTEENDQEKEESDESIEVEKQVLGLLESNMSGAMQFLRSNGLCLMPISLAAAISACKGAADRKKAHLANHDSRPIKTCDCRTKEEN